MNVLVVGSGAREHTIAWAIKKSSKLKKLYVAPGNAGTAQIATNLPIEAPDYNYSDSNQWAKYFNLILTECTHLSIDLVVVQNEEPLAKGLVDYLEKHGFACFGPNKNGALLESSKVFSQNFLEMVGIPHASGTVIKNYSPNLKLPKNQLVVKASGLAKGKGVIVAKTPKQVAETVRSMMVEGRFGKAGQEVVVQELLQGREVSSHAFSDGEWVIDMPLACDYKRIGDGDTGENTGGIGCYSPPSWVKKRDKKALGEFTHLIIEAFDLVNNNSSDFQGWRKKIFDSKGVIYPAYFVTDQGPKVIECNCRFGDPETQVILPRLESDLLEVMLACATRKLKGLKISWSKDFCVCVVLCSQGYPESQKIKIGVPIHGLGNVPDDVMVFHAATKTNLSGRIVTNGGRVLSVVAKGPTLEQARKKVYEAIKEISFEGMYYRRDIALAV